jgi:hypothetical protein
LASGPIRHNTSAILFLFLPENMPFPLRPKGWKTSWFARGILFSVFFGTLAFIQPGAGRPDIAR